MLAGVMWLWFILTALSVAFVVFDIPHTPEATVMKWGFVIITAFIGPFGAFLYVLGCREPLPDTHEEYVAVHWRQVLGSTMHCVAGDGVGILAAAVLASWLRLPMAVDIALEYTMGFLFGWMVFQALFMRDMAGGSYRRSLAITFFPEFVSMNGVMAGMLAVRLQLLQRLPGADNPAAAVFWFSMSMALLAGFIVAYPINDWLVTRGLKHGMMTVRPSGQPLPRISGLYTSGQALTKPAAGGHKAVGHGVTGHEATRHEATGHGGVHTGHDHGRSERGGESLFGITVLSLALLVAGIVVGRSALP